MALKGHMTRRVIASVLALALACAPAASALASDGGDDRSSGATDVVIHFPEGVPHQDDGSGGDGAGSSADGAGAGDAGQAGQEEAVVPYNPLEQMGADGTAFGRGASGLAAAAAIAALPNDDDPAGTVYGKLRLRAGKVTQKSIKLKWTRVPSAKTYVLYGNRCGKANKMKQIKVSAAGSFKVTKVNGKKLQKGRYHKFMVVALDANGNVVSSSKVIHVATKGGKFGNDKSVIAKTKDRVKLKSGKKVKVKAAAKAQSAKLKVKRHRKVSFESSNASIATVNAKGVVKGVKKGTCFIYAYAQDGVYKRVKVIVK